MRRNNSIPMSFYALDNHRALTCDARSLLLYFGTNAHSNLLGCYRLPISYIADDLQWHKENVKYFLDELIEHEFIDYDEEYQWIWVKPFLSWNPLYNLSQGQGIAKLFNQITPELSFHEELVKHLQDYAEYLPTTFTQRLEAINRYYERFTVKAVDASKFITLQASEVMLASKADQSLKKTYPPLKAAQ